MTPRICFIACSSSCSCGASWDFPDSRWHVNCSVYIFRFTLACQLFYLHFLGHWVAASSWVQSYIEKTQSHSSITNYLALTIFRCLSPWFPMSLRHRSSVVGASIGVGRPKSVVLFIWLVVKVPATAEGSTSDDKWDLHWSVDVKTKLRIQM